MRSYEIRGFEVVEVATGDFPREEVVYKGCDEGSALAVARALAAYWDVPAVIVHEEREYVQPVR